MPGYRLKEGQVKNKSSYSKYKCHSCSLTLREAVQPSCGHWLCESCIQELFKLDTPVCPNCKESLRDDDSDDEQAFFPDNFVRREVSNLSIKCEWFEKGCDWEGKLKDYEVHLGVCKHKVVECSKCGGAKEDDHECPEGRECCPLAVLGCEHKNMMNKDNLNIHIQEDLSTHMKIIAKAIIKYEVQQQKESVTASVKSQKQNSSKSVPPLSSRRFHEDDDGYNSGRLTSNSSSNYPSSIQVKGLTPLGGDTEKDGVDKQLSMTIQKDPSSVYQSKGLTPLGGGGKLSMSLQDPSAMYPHDPSLVSSRERAYLYGTAAAAVSDSDDIVAKLMTKVDAVVKSDLRRKDDEIMSLKSTVLKLEKTVKAKHAELEDRDFRLSLIENSNYDGTMVWKIPQFSQRMSDAHSGKYTSIFSLPFYTSRYGYKMCLRLYILGDGIGKNNYMSLFFVIMRGEFDNILNWPFTHKVTFRLINQNGNRDVIDTFQPEPTSSSFRKPKSDMNIASGCPRFISHNDLKSKGFVADDTIFIKCEVDTKNIPPV